MINTEKPIVICLFGFMAVGKLTIGQKLHQETGINFSHNHLLNDYVTSMFPRGNKTRHELMEKYKIETLERMVQERFSCITTEAYMSNYVSLMGTEDTDFLLSMEKAVLDNGGVFYGIHLIADNTTLLSRISNEDRRKHGKLIDKDIAKDIFEKDNSHTSPEFINLLKIDTSKNSPEESVQKIIDFIQQKQSA